VIICALDTRWRKWIPTTQGTRHRRRDCVIDSTFEIRILKQNNFWYISVLTPLNDKSNAMTAETTDFHIIHEPLVQYYGRLVPSIHNYELLVLHAAHLHALCGTKISMNLPFEWREVRPNMSHTAIQWNTSSWETLTPDDFFASTMMPATLRYLAMSSCHPTFCCVC